MSGKRVLIRFLMLLMLWGALVFMFTVTKNINPWVRVAIGIGLCALYTYVQMKLNRKYYGGKNGDPNIPTVDKDNSEEE